MTNPRSQKAEEFNMSHNVFWLVRNKKHGGDAHYYFLSDSGISHIRPTNSPSDCILSSQRAVATISTGWAVARKARARNYARNSPSPGAPRLERPQKSSRYLSKRLGVSIG